MAYTDDGYIKAKLSVTLEVLLDVKNVLKEDAGLDLNFDKTEILVKGISAADAHAAAQRMINADLSLAYLSPLLSLASFVVDGYIGLGVPINTKAPSRAPLLLPLLLSHNLPLPSVHQCVMGPDWLCTAKQS